MLQYKSCVAKCRLSLSISCRSHCIRKKIFLLRVVRRVNNLMKLSDVQMAYFLCDKLMLSFH